MANTLEKIQVGTTTPSVTEIQQIEFTPGATGTWTVFGTTLSLDTPIATVQSIIDANYAAAQSGEQMFVDYNFADEYPAGLLAGDIVIYAEVFPTVSSLPLTVSPNNWSDLPSGWTKALHDTTTSYLWQSRVAYRVADGSETPGNKIHPDAVNRPIYTLRYADSDLSNAIVAFPS